MRNYYYFYLISCCLISCSSNTPNSPSKDFELVQKQNSSPNTTNNTKKINLSFKDNKYHLNSRSIEDSDIELMSSTSDEWIVLMTVSSETNEYELQFNLNIQCPKLSIGKKPILSGMVNFYDAKTGNTAVYYVPKNTSTSYLEIETLELENDIITENSGFTYYTLSGNFHFEVKNMESGELHVIQSGKFSNLRAMNIAHPE